MKKLLSLLVAGTMMFALVACNSGESADATTSDSTQTGTSSTVEETPTDDSTVEETPADDSSDEETPAAEPDPNAEPTALFYSSNVEDLAGTWNLVQVYADGATSDATEGAMSLEVALTEDPSELVDEAAYIHNRVYNMSGTMTFGIDAINEELSADGIDGYRGSTAWSDFPQGEVVEEGNWYKQPGPATMRFQDVDAYGLFLDQIAGVSADIDTSERSLIIGLNNQGQLLLGYSEEHLERPGTEGDWTYCLIFDKAA